MRIGINAHLLAFAENYRQAGLSRYIYELLLRLPAAAPKARFIAYVGNHKPPTDLRAALPGNLRLSNSLLPTQRAPVRIAWEQTLLPIAAARDRLALLHCPVNVRPLLSPCPTVVTVHDLIFLRYPEKFQPAKRLYLKVSTTWSCRHAAHVIAVSEATRRDVVDLLGVNPERVTTVHNGVGEQFRPLDPQTRETFRQDKGIAGRLVLFLGTLEPRKNVQTLLQAFAALARDATLDDVTLAIGGSKGWYYDEIFSTAERLGLQESGRVRFLGRVPDEELPLWYNIAAVFAYPSLYEGFGLPVLEAMACGVPVLASNTSSFPEVVSTAGMLLDPLDVSAWSQAMRELLANTTHAKELSKRGLVQASEFSWDRAARATLDIYNQVLSAKRRGV
jgi:glycosyltransferase involved in cell wall biosynthesis